MSDDANSVSPVGRDVYRPLREALTAEIKSYAVGLSVHSAHGRTPFGGVATGFLFEYAGAHFWITAGHVINDIERQYGDDRFANTQAAWLTAHESLHARRIPCCLDGWRSFACDDERLDLGGVLLNQLDLRNLQVGHRFLTEEIWRSLELAEPLGYVLIGYPESAHTRTTVHETKSAVTEICSAVMRVEALEAVSELDYAEAPDSFWDSQGSVYFRRLAASGLDADPRDGIPGMSGGPIFAITSESPWLARYWLAGIQRSTHPRDPDVLRATRPDLLASMCEEALRRR